MFERLVGPAVAIFRLCPAGQQSNMSMEYHHLLPYFVFLLRSQQHAASETSAVLGRYDTAIEWQLRLMSTTYLPPTRTKDYYKPGCLCGRRSGSDNCLLYLMRVRLYSLRESRKVICHRWIVLFSGCARSLLTAPCINFFLCFSLKTILYSIIVFYSQVENTYMMSYLVEALHKWTFTTTITWAVLSRRRPLDLSNPAVDSFLDGKPVLTKARHAISSIYAPLQ